jgi:hypothetical protein
MDKKSAVEGEVPPPPQKRNLKRNLNGSVCLKQLPVLSPARAEIYGYFEYEGLTSSQIAARRGCSKRYVRKVHQWLKNQGILSMVPPPLLEGGEAPRNLRNLFGVEKQENRRLHAQKFRVEIIDSSPRYHEKVNVSLTVDGNNVQCFEKVLLIQANDKSFYGVTEDEAFEVSMVYWRNFFRRLEHDLNIVILKERCQNIQMTYAEWATGPCELSREMEERGGRIMVYDSVDGKLRYTTDKSLGHEREAHHYRKGKEDSETGNRFIEDVLEHPEAPTFTELVKVIKLQGNNIERQGKHLEEAAAGLNSIIKVLNPKKEVIDDEKPLKKPDYFG